MDTDTSCDRETAAVHDENAVSVLALAAMLLAAALAFSGGDVFRGDARIFRNELSADMLETIPGVTSKTAQKISAAAKAVGGVSAAAERFIGEDGAWRLKRLVHRDMEH